MSMLRVCILLSGVLLIGCAAHKRDLPVENEIVSQLQQVRQAKEFEVKKTVEAFSKALQGTQVNVERHHDTVKLLLPGDQTFALNQATVNKEFYPILDKVVSVLQKYPDSSIEIAGYASNDGPPTINRNVSEKRAKSVGEYLLGHKIERDRIVIVGFGDQRPIADNDTEAGRAKNRRVELTVTPKVDPTELLIDTGSAEPSV